MRILTLIPLALLTSACWTPGPGQVDPSRYPWDPANRKVTANRTEVYCVIALEPGKISGIVFGGKASAQSGCGASSTDPQDQAIDIMCHPRPHPPSLVNSTGATPKKPSCGGQ